MTARRTTKEPDPDQVVTTDLTQFEKSDLAIRKAATQIDAQNIKAELAVRILELENPADDRVKSAADAYLIKFFQDADQ